MYYGLCNGMNLEVMAIEVCECLGFGAYDNAHLLLLETAAAETHLGEVDDKSIYAGMGLTQFDKMPFYDVKNRSSYKTKKRVRDYFGIDIELVEWEHLRYNPLLALIFTRMKYILIPAAIPQSIEGRAAYWKKWYNSELGKGTVSHYLQASNNYRFA